MRRVAICALLAAGLLSAALFAAAPAGADKDFSKYKLESVSAGLSSALAGAHADLAVNLELSSTEEVPAKPWAFTRDVVVKLPPGLIGNPQPFPHCTLVEFGAAPQESECPQDAQVGVTEVTLAGTVNGTLIEPIYNMESPGGDVAARFGFFAGPYPTLLNVRLNPKDYTLEAAVEGAASAAEVLSARTTIWGVPAAPVHDELRLTPQEGTETKLPPGGRDSGLPEVPFLSNPTDCSPGKQITVTATSYQRPDEPSSMSAPFPQLGSCELLELDPSATGRPTTTQATTPSGFDYDLNLPTKGLEFPNLKAPSHLKRAEVVLPEGMSVNPSSAEGLGVCSQADLDRETYNSGPDVGCPESSKIGSVKATTPVLDRDAVGSLYLAKPYENPFGSLIALYMVLKVPDRGVLVKAAGRVTPDPQTGQLTTVFDDIPQLPVATFSLRFREGARAPLVTPSACGPYTVASNFSPWSVPSNVIAKTSGFQIESGPNHGPCPSGGLPPFHPGLLAYATNQIAGAFSPFYVKLSRDDTEQEITHFSIKLPPGLVGKLAGVPFCSEAGIQQAISRKGPHGGEEEINSPSCPAASQVGTSLAGAGVGQVLTYVPGKIYLAGPYHGSALSIVAITAAKAGPFDLGTVVIREALKIDPETAEVFIDATGSDPIPHIIAGVPVHLRDIRAFVDRPDFTLNPTDCTPTSTASTVLGSGLDFASEADDNPLTVTSPFQVADCAALPFKPKLALKLKGGTKRGSYPAFTATLKGQGLGAAGIARTQVTLPHSEFIANAHFKTICTRVQFKAASVPGAACPTGSIYGKAEARTPLLDEPLTGPVFLRSSEHQLPDLVIALHSGKIDVTLVGKVDSVKGQLRTTFESVPDAPVTSFRLEMQGGRKGLFENSTDLCKGKHRALAQFDGQNGKKLELRPALQVKCGNGSARHSNHGRKR